MKMLGFTAETSLRKTINHYRMVGTSTALASDSAIRPQLKFDETFVITPTKVCYCYCDTVKKQCICECE